MKRFVALLLVLTAVAMPASASDKPKDKGPAASTVVDLRPVAVPVVVSGQVRNYVFVTVRLMPGSKADITALREKEQFFRDALVRAAHRAPFTLADDYNRVDEARIAAVIMAASPRIAGPGQVKAAVVVKQQPKNIRRSPRTLGAKPAVPGAPQRLGLN